LNIIQSNRINIFVKTIPSLILFYLITATK